MPPSDSPRHPSVTLVTHEKGCKPFVAGGFVTLSPFFTKNPIRHVEYLPAEMVPENPGKKNSVVDVRCREKAWLKAWRKEQIKPIA